MLASLYGFLAEAPDGLSQTELARRALKLAAPGGGEPLVVAVSLEIRRLLEGDVRFRLEPPDRWHLAVPPVAGGGPYDPPAETALDAITFTVVDLETTGCRAGVDRVIEVGAVRLTGGRVAERFQSFVHPGRTIPAFITRLTGIDDEMVDGAPPFAEVAGEVRAFVGDSVVVAHNAAFDGRFLDAELSAATGRPLERPTLCTVRLARRLLAGVVPRMNLDTVADHYGLAFDGRHRALGDAEVTALVLVRFLERCADEGITSWGDLRRLTTRRRLRKRVSTGGPADQREPKPRMEGGNA